jgi:hypothetical protein
MTHIPPTPEQRLMKAVLDDAIAVHAATDGARDRRRRRLREEVAEWFASDAAEYVFSFVNVCRALGLEPAGVRAGLVRDRQAHAA